MSALATKESARSIVTVGPSSSQPGSKMASKVRKITSMKELEESLESSKNKLLLIEFFAEWCGPCKLIAAKLEQWAQMFDVTIVKIDVDDLEEVALNYNVSGIPAFVLIKDKKKIDQIEGSQEDHILEILDQNCTRNPNYVHKAPENAPPEQINVTTTISTTTGNVNTEENPKKGE